ncbi:MAG TPA: aromatic amino acid transaminase [Terricaulis sp.]|nr:aromatic amino acid transaminase [Terricaulis sp.]
MIDDIQPKAADPLLKIIKMFGDDPREDKIDLGVGVYRDEHGQTPVMAAVKEAERRLHAEQRTKTYVGQQGDTEFLQLMGELAFGAAGRDLVSIQAVGGTGALRLGFDFLRAAGAKRVLLPTPSWANHPGLIAAAGLEQVDVKFFDVAAQRIDIAPLLSGIARLAPGDAVLLQGCCHNPLGADFDAAQWAALAQACAEARVTAFVDVAYLGFGDGLERDAEGVRRILAHVPNVVVSLSGAKSFGVYRERVGALYVKAAPRARDAVQSNLFTLARSNYSMPPDHGAACVRTVLADAGLRAMWADELEGIRQHILKTRAALSAAHVNALPMQSIAAQKGMFSTLPLALAQIEALRGEHGVYMTDGGRINVAGLPARDAARFLDALRAVTR